MKKLQAILFKIDLFGISVNLLQKKSEKYNTYLGSIFSIAIVTFTLISFVNLVIEMFQRQSPNVLSSVEANPNPEVISLIQSLQAFALDPDNFLIALGVGDKSGFPIINLPNMTLFKAYVKSCTQTIGVNQTTNSPQVQITCKNYTMDLCSKMNLNQDFLSELAVNKKQFNFTYCINDSSWRADPIIIEGVSSSNVFRYPVIKVEKCENTSTFKCKYILISQFVACAPSELINKKLSDGYFAVMIADRLLDQKKAGPNPYRAINKANVFSLRPSTQKIVSYYFRHSYTVTKENFFYYFTTTFISHVLQFEGLIESTNPASNSELLHVNILLDDKTITYFRSYDNLLNILGSISGLYELLLVFASFFLIPLTKLSQNLTLVNAVFSFETPNNFNAAGSYQGKRSSQISPDKIFQEKNRQMKSVFKLVETSNASREQGIRKMSVTNLQEGRVLRKFLKQKQNKLSFNGFEKLTFFCGGAKKKQLDQSFNKISQKLDVTFILQKLIEIDKLKMLLLSNEQFKLFDLLPKPTIMYDSQKSFAGDLYFAEERSFESKLVEAMEAYRNNRFNNDMLNQRLLQLINPEFKEVFEQIIGLEKTNKEKTQYTFSIPKQPDIQSMSGKVKENYSATEEIQDIF